MIWGEMLSKLFHLLQWFKMRIIILTLLNKLIRDLNTEAQYVPNVIILKEESISER